MTEDIANRLRNKHADDLLAWEAAAEIERLRAELDGARLGFRGASYDRDRMRSERDEARCDACMTWAWMYRPSENAETEARKEAERRGWDCFRRGK